MSPDLRAIVTRAVALPGCPIELRTGWHAMEHAALVGHMLIALGPGIALVPPEEAGERWVVVDCHDPDGPALGVNRYAAGPVEALCLTAHSLGEWPGGHDFGGGL
jgi:hypothetical protein